MKTSYQSYLYPKTEYIFKIDDRGKRRGDVMVSLQNSGSSIRANGYQPIKYWGNFVMDYHPIQGGVV